LPVPDVTVAEFPAESVTVNCTDNACDAPSSVLESCPHVSENDNVGDALVDASVFTVT